MRKEVGVTFTLLSSPPPSLSRLVRIPGKEAERDSGKISEQLADQPPHRPPHEMSLFDRTHN